MQIVIFSGGKFTSNSLAKAALKSADIILAADSGAKYAIEQHTSLKAVVGDFDSLDKSTKKVLKKKQVEFITMPTTLKSLPKGLSKPLNNTEKDQTDTELAIEYALQLSATHITIFAGVEGDRFDHILGNLFVATTYSIPIEFMSNNQRTWIEKGPKKVHLEGKKGDILSLIPLSEKVESITTSGLYYPLQNDSMVFGHPRGISNVFTKKTAEVTFGNGTMIFVHTMV